MNTLIVFRAMSEELTKERGKVAEVTKEFDHILSGLETSPRESFRNRYILQVIYLIMHIYLENTVFIISNFFSSNCRVTKGRSGVELKFRVSVFTDNYYEKTDKF